MGPHQDARAIKDVEGLEGVGALMKPAPSGMIGTPRW